MAQNFTFADTALPGVKLIRPFFAADERGFFSKYFEIEIFRRNGIHFPVSECFESLSMQYVLRGLHFQTGLAQAKLVRVISGEVWDAVADLRKDSPTFCRWIGRSFSAANREMLFIPPGFAHGYFVLSPEALMSYQCAGRYDPETDSGVVWNDARIGIRWPLPPAVTPILSQRDRELPTVDEWGDKLMFREVRHDD